MKIQVVSDLHLEFGEVELSFEGADMVVLAGDVDLGVKGIQWILQAIPTKSVIYVLGNHEYYKGSYPRTLHKIIDASAGTNVHVLENKAVSVDGVTFHGATLWTDFELLGNARVNGSICQEKMNDYKMIRRDPSYSKLRSVDTYHIHQSSMRWLEQSLESSATDKNIVVTHHAPSMQSVPLKYREDIVTSAYASNLDATILKYQPAYWIHGHIHEPSDYTVGATRVLCNPRGYVSEPDAGFKPGLTIEI